MINSFSIRRAIVLGIILATSCSVFTGCSTVTYAPYRGQQQNWPTAPGAFAIPSHGTLLYLTPPEKPYTILGLLIISSDPSMIDSEIARFARQVKADAFLVDAGENRTTSVTTDISHFQWGNYGNTTVTSWGNVVTTVRGRLIRFTSEDVSPHVSTNATH